MTAETQTYTIELVLSTENGELPEPADVETLVRDQMGGTLDETTGLRCIDVYLNGWGDDE